MAAAYRRSKITSTSPIAGQPYAPNHALRSFRKGIAVGKAADLVMWNAKSPAEVCGGAAVMGYKRGRRTFTREIATLDFPSP